MKKAYQKPTALTIAFVAESPINTGSININQTGPRVSNEIEIRSIRKPSWESYHTVSEEEEE